MNVKVTLLNVKDGDAIIVELTKEGKALVIVIDGGQPGYYASKVKPALEKILSNHNKKAPDVVVCTHYDSDHIGGLIPLIEEYIDDIREVWIHKTPSLIKGFIEKAIQLESNNGLVHIESKDKKEIGSLFENYRGKQKKQLDIKADLILESLPQLKKLIDLIPADKLRQVFNKQHPLREWKEIAVLGPTKDYYKSLFPATQSFAQFIKEETEGTLEDGKQRLKILKSAGITSCDALKKDKDAKLTATNKASIIIAIDNSNGRYLFTGDAGIESFKKIPDYKTELKNIYFLKVPHHASDNNISRELIELMQPVYAYNTGDKYEDAAVLECLKAKARSKEVKSTKKLGDLFFDK